MKSAGYAGNDIIDGVLGADRPYGSEGDDLFKSSAVRVSFPPPTDCGLIDRGSGSDTIEVSNLSPVEFRYLGSKLTLKVGSQLFPSAT